MLFSSALGERYDEAFQKCQIVRLEGPKSVADAAQRLIFAAADFPPSCR